MTYPDGVFEVEVRVTDAKNQESARHFEYTASAGDPRGAAGEIVDAIVKERGIDRVKMVDADR